MNQRNGVFHLMLIGLMGLAGANVYPGPVDHAWAKMQSWRYRRRGEAVWAVAGTNRVNVMKMLLSENSSQLNARRPVEYDSRGWVIGPPYHDCTPLMIAVHCGCVRMVRYLLARGADPNIGRSSDAHRFNAPLIEAVRTGNRLLAELLLDNGADVNFPNRGIDALSSAVLAQNYGMVRLLLDQGANAHDDALIWAVKRKDQEIVRMLLCHVVRADYGVLSSYPHAQTALEWAAMDDNIDMVRLLLDRGALLVPGRSEGALKAALAHGKEEVWTLFLERIADANGYLDMAGESLLSTAVFHGRIDVVRQLLARGARIDHRSRDQKTALYWLGGLSDCNYYALVKLLLAWGADINVQDRDGRTPLHEAATQRRLETTEALIRHGADVHARDKNGMTPLHAAGHCGTGRLLYWRGFLSDGFDDVARVLVARGAELSGSLEASLMARKRALYRELARIRRERIQTLRSLLRQLGTYRDIDTLILQLAGQSEDYIRRFDQLGAHNA